MSFFSKSSRKSQYKSGQNGSDHYKKKGGIDNLFQLIMSRSASGGHYNNNRNPYFNTPTQYQTLSNQATGNCDKCGSQIPAGSKFCLECGAAVTLATTCNRCGENVPPNSKFCMVCGNKLGV